MQSMFTLARKDKVNRWIAEKAEGWTAPRIGIEARPPFPEKYKDFDYFNPPKEVEDWRSNFHWRQPDGSCWDKHPQYTDSIVDALRAAGDMDDWEFTIILHRDKEVTVRTFNFKTHTTIWIDDGIESVSKAVAMACGQASGITLSRVEERLWRTYNEFDDEIEDGTKG